MKRYNGVRVRLQVPQQLRVLVGHLAHRRLPERHCQVRAPQGREEVDGDDESQRRFVWQPFAARPFDALVLQKSSCTLSFFFGLEACPTNLIPPASRCTVPQGLRERARRFLELSILLSAIATSAASIDAEARRRVVHSDRRTPPHEPSMLLLAPSGAARLCRDRRAARVLQLLGLCARPGNVRERELLVPMAHLHPTHVSSRAPRAAGTAHTARSCAVYAPVRTTPQGCRCS